MFIYYVQVFKNPSHLICCIKSYINFVLLLRDLHYVILFHSDNRKAKADTDCRVSCLTSSKGLPWVLL